MAGLNNHFNDIDLTHYMERRYEQDTRTLLNTQYPMLPDYPDHSTWEIRDSHAVATIIRLGIVLLLLLGAHAAYQLMHL